jgi:hypothetical protein
MPNELIGPREHNWLTSKVLSTAVRAYSTGSVTLRTGHPTLIERVCAGQRGMVGAGGVEPPSSSVSAKCKEPLCGRSFLQVAPDRRGRSYMLPWRSVKCSSDVLRASLTPRCPSRPPAQRRPSSPPSTCTYAPQHAPGNFHQHFLTRLTPQSLAFLLSRLPSTRTIQLQATSWRPRTWCTRGLSSPTPLRRDRGSTCIASAWSRLQKRGDAAGCPFRACLAWAGVTGDPCVVPLGVHPAALRGVAHG